MQHFRIVLDETIQTASKIRNIELFVIDWITLFSSIAAILLYDLNVRGELRITTNSEKGIR